MQRFLKLCGKARKEDVVATATALTVHTIADSVRRLVPGRADGAYKDLIVAGGGSRNRTMMKWLDAELRPLGLTLSDSSAFGVPAESKEAIAFAVLAYLTWKHQPGNVPSATGASKAVILGKISYA